MINVLKFVLVGLVGGVLGGMGMGGGTILIPLLTVFLGVFQKSAQAINLISFIPMAVIALIMHLKNKLLKKDGVLFIVIPACIFAVGGSVLCLFINAGVLRRIFGGFLIALSLLQFFLDAVLKKLDAKRKNVNKKI